ncbi:MAG: SDR family oxidoreductase [Bacteroidetes bacterium]|jgi:nucleoside-diphosphate-sugar epimerase|nr:SDR family oxidoreductase [Bacteroidota bacterium]MBT5531401.1 SDR family oxidoreductase [Cytophagia bacterium]MBT3422383.1 SDR family oxidoreductase [Bacteroidota bacterium]MBT3800591.1 SDR family oxidoreductase [Bacteroidota bacterium]MBT3932862.1 SDR family oxidoreductase [Bacteroidota bacterium]
MKILVAGGAGFIGSVMVPKLAERGYDVTVLDLLWFGNHLPKSINVLKKNIFDLTDKDLVGFDQVIFLAGLSNDPMAEFSPKDNFIQNASAPAYLGYIAKVAGVKRFIYAGSCSVYGYTVNELYDESSPAISNYPYGISKLQGEHSVLQMQDENFSVVAFRQGTVSGFSPRMRLDLIVNTMFKSALEKNEITVNNPSIWRPILSIKDATSAYIRAVEANYDISGVFNIASGNYTVGEVADLVKEVVEEKMDKTIHLNIKNIQDFRNYKVSFEKAMNILSYKPNHDVKSIVADLISNLDYFKDFANPNFYNINVFRSLKENQGSI